MEKKEEARGKCVVGSLIPHYNIYNIGLIGKYYYFLVNLYNLKNLLN
jgi:hypothetical protein